MLADARSFGNRAYFMQNSLFLPKRLQNDLFCVELDVKH